MNNTELIQKLELINTLTSEMLAELKARENKPIKTKKLSKFQQAYNKFDLMIK